MQGERRFYARRNFFMKQFKLSGIVVPIITPIDKEENVNEA